MVFVGQVSPIWNVLTIVLLPKAFVTFSSISGRTSRQFPPLSRHLARNSYCTLAILWPWASTLSCLRTAPTFSWIDHAHSLPPLPQSSCHKSGYSSTSYLFSLCWSLARRGTPFASCTSPASSSCSSCLSSVCPTLPSSPKNWCWLCSRWAARSTSHRARARTSGRTAGDPSASSLAAFTAMCILFCFLSSFVPDLLFYELEHNPSLPPSSVASLLTTHWCLVAPSIIPDPVVSSRTGLFQAFPVYELHQWRVSSQRTRSFSCFPSPDQSSTSR